MASFGQDASMLLTVYRCTFDLLRADVFTAHAAFVAVCEHFGGYRRDEVDAALELMVEHGHLRHGFIDKPDEVLGWLYMASIEHPMRARGR